MSIKEKTLKLVAELEPFNNGVEWDNDFECWTMCEDTYTKFNRLLDYVKEIYAFEKATTIKANKLIFDGSTSFKIVDSEICCSELINSPNIVLNSEYGFGEFNSKTGDYEDDYSIKLVRAVEDCEGWTDYFYEKIDFCPFCGSPISIKIFRTIDKTEEYKALSAERDILWKKCQKTDSKKKENEIRDKVKTLDSLMEKICINDSLECCTEGECNE